MTKPVSAVTRVNQQLKAQGREERLVRGRGYYYMHSGDTGRWPATSIYVYRIGPEDYAFAAREVQYLFAQAGIHNVTFEGASK